jgi:hypothetical protein
LADFGALKGGERFSFERFSAIISTVASDLTDTLLRWMPDNPTNTDSEYDTVFLNATGIRHGAGSHRMWRRQ